MSPRVLPTHTKSRNAVNSLRLLLEKHGHIVEEIPGASDFGEDLRVTFVHRDERTGYVVAVQVKSGGSLRRKHGFSVPIGRHAANWADSNVPVICVVLHVENQSLNWANATQQLRHAKLAMQQIRAVSIPSHSLLNDDTVALFFAEMKGYIDSSRSIHVALEELAGISLTLKDYVAFAPNEVGESMVFVQRAGEDRAILIHSDLEREPIRFTDEDLERWAEPPGRGLRDDDGPIIDENEKGWLHSCWLNSHWHRRPSLR